MWDRALKLALNRLIRFGKLTVALPDGTEQTFGDGTGQSIRLTIHDSPTLRRLVLNPELAVGEAYMDGKLTIDGDDLRGFLALALSNLNDPARVWWQDAHHRLRAGTRRFMQNNVAALARRNVAHHYDLSGELYDLFLDADRQYSCAYFHHPHDTLEEAQAQKKAHIARKLRLSPGQHVLDIGCGWGGMALTLAREHGVKVLGITLSKEQLQAARTRAKKAGLADKVDFQLIDYRDVGGTFDRIVSVGMFEHVGLPHFDSYFRALGTLLKPDGVALVHSIGMSEAPSATNPWIAKYIFPGGYVPSLSEMIASVERQNLWITDVECLRLHYAETLHHWYDRFTSHADRVAELYDERFVRMWKYYLASSEQAFRYRRQAVFQVQIARQVDAVPITRDYLYSKGSREVLKAAE